MLGCGDGSPHGQGWNLQETGNVRGLSNRDTMKAMSSPLPPGGVGWYRPLKVPKQLAGVLA